MQVELADVTIHYRTVELPDACPECGATFTGTDDENVRVPGISSHTGYGTQIPDNDEGIMYDEADFPERMAVVEYSCIECDWEVAGTWAITRE